MAHRRIKVAAAQLLTSGDVAANARMIEAAIREAHAQRCHIVLFHEGALNGYPPHDRFRKLDMDQVLMAERRVRRLAARLGIAVLLGTVGQEGRNFYNDVLVIDEKGVSLGRYTKTWRAGEHWYEAGEGPVVFRIAGVDATVIICHDLRYPELARLGVAAGARIVFIANNESGLDQEKKLLGYRSMQISRATENGVFAVMCNAPADPHDITRLDASHGNSMIVDPAGNVMDEAGAFEQRLVTATLDLKLASRTFPLRTLAQNREILERYKTDCENPQMRDWIRAGLKLVRRLDGRIGRR